MDVAKGEIRVGLGDLVRFVVAVLIGLRDVFNSDACALDREGAIAVLSVPNDAHTPGLDAIGLELPAQLHLLGAKGS